MMADVLIVHTDALASKFYFNENSDFIFANICLKLSLLQYLFTEYIHFKYHFVYPPR